MIAHYFLLVLVSGLFPFIVFLLLDHLSYLRHRSVDEVGDCHVKPDHELIQELLDPANEIMGCENSRPHQRRRMEKLRQQLALKRSNARVDMQWGATEWHDMMGRGAREVYGEDLEQQAWWKEWFAGNLRLRECATVMFIALTVRLVLLWFRGLSWWILPTPRLASMRRTRMVCVIVRIAQIKIWMTSLFHPQEWKALSAFKFAAFLESGEIDYRQVYAQLKTAVRSAGRSHGDDIAEYIVSKM